MTYWQTYRPWLIRLLNERIYLSERGYCPDLLEIAVSLKKLVHFNGYRSDTKLAAFMLRRKREILILIPANKAHDNQHKKLQTALQMAENLVFEQQTFNYS